MIGGANLFVPSKPLDTAYPSNAMTPTPPPDPRRLSQQLKIQTAANRYAKLLQDSAARVIARIVNS
jgi:hypothetical protein